MLQYQAIITIMCIKIGLQMMNNEIPTFSRPVITETIPTEHHFQQSARRAVTWHFAFRGNAMDYFKIWITNLFLTIITCSLYAPWAKVRRLQYFYGNTYLNRHNFSFTALPTRILVGRLIAMGLFLIIALISNFAPEYSFIGTLLLFALAPWLIRSTMRFRARNSKYGNIRFVFSADLIKSYGILIACGILLFFTLGLAYPIALLLFKRYQFKNLKVGHLKFNLKATIWDFYKAVLVPIIFAVFVLFAVIIFLFTSLSSLSQDTISIFFFSTYIIIFAFIMPLINAYLFRATWNNVSIGKNKMQTSIKPFTYAWIQLSNYIAIIFSFGLLFAWAKVRMYSYQMENLSVTFVNDPEDLINISQAEYNSVAEEITDVFDIDISL